MTLTPIPCTRRRVAACAGAAWVAALLAGATAHAAEPPTRRPSSAPVRPRTKVDHAVVPAGGLYCEQCGPAGSHVRRGHLAECRDGLCAPHCPVRPSQHGYYGTQWRRWPGQDVVPASAEEAVTPAPPPKAQVPTADEESPQAPIEEPAPPEADAANDATTARPDAARGESRPARLDDVLPTDPIPENVGVDEAAPAEPNAPRAMEPAPPRREPPVPPVPPGETPVPSATGADAGLFDQSAVPPVEADEVQAAGGAMRYPTLVGRSLATGAEPWRLEPARRQRPADSARGL